MARRFHYDQLIHELKMLVLRYPEFAEILKQLIQELEQEKTDSILYSLQEDSDW